jgi:hypothetical protein
MSSATSSSFRSHSPVRPRPNGDLPSSSPVALTPSNIPDVVLMAITSQLRPAPLLGEVWLRGWRDAGLLKTSAVKPVIATLEQGLVIRRLGLLDAADQAALRTALAEIIA